MTDTVEDGDPSVAPSASAVWEGPADTPLRAAIAFLWPNRFPTQTSAKKSANKGEAWVNGERMKGKRAGAKTVQPGDTISRQQLATRRGKEVACTERAPTLVVAYLDPVLAVVVKPAGMSVMGGKKSDSEVLTMHRLLFHKLPAASAAVHPLQRPSCLHRLDKLTAGLMAVARTVPCARDVTAQLESRQVQKRYRAVLHGNLIGESGEVNAALDDKECRSGWQVVERLSYDLNQSTSNDVNCHTQLTLVDLFPHTGRMHQLRRHCRKIGHPIVGDPQYGLERDDAALSTHMTSGPEEQEPVIPVSLMLAAVDLKLSHPEAHYKARTIDPDVSGSWAFAADSSCTYADGSLRVQTDMPLAMQRLVEAGRRATTSTTIQETTSTLPLEDCVSQL
jgi:23S rRNA-/tRNA-specific pseudouridylate synthase